MIRGESAGDGGRGGHGAFLDGPAANDGTLGAHALWSQLGLLDRPPSTPVYLQRHFLGHGQRQEAFREDLYPGPAGPASVAIERLVEETAADRPETHNHVTAPFVDLVAVVCR